MSSPRNNATRYFFESIILIFLSACGGGTSSPSTTSAVQHQQIALAIVNGVPSNTCLNGGITVQTGIDTNDNQVLEPSEATSAQYVCNGTNGTIGSIKQELPGSNCISGGSIVSTGLDSNLNGILEASEVTSNAYICNGSAGLNGSNGASGSVGATGIGGATGSTGYVGAAGAAGVAGSVGATGSVGSSGANGSTGLTGATGSNGSNGVNGVNGTDGFNSLFLVTVEPVGVNCLQGGSKATAGKDVNANNVLDSAEVTSTTYICAGATGANGAAGVAGASGATGLTGATGGTGAAGPTGATGGVISAYAYIYNLKEQTVKIGEPVYFDSNGPLLGVRHERDASEITILSSGTYIIFFSISATEPNQFALFINYPKNEKPVPGSVYGSGAGTQQITGQIILELAAEDTLVLRNFSSAAEVILPSLMGGTEANVNASISIQRLN
jgi:hypothetical protein